MAGLKHIDSDKHRIIYSVLMPAIAQTISLSSQQEKNILRQLEERSRYHFYPKENVVERPGGFDESYAWFVVRGFVRSYIFDYETATDKTLLLWKRHDIIMSSDCFIEKNQRSHYIQMLEDGYLLSLSYRDLEFLLTEIPDLTQVFNLLHSERERRHTRHLKWLGLRPLYMVEQLLIHYPGIDRVNQRHLASFLNCTRGTFSLALNEYRRLRDLSV
jgi:CRP-like cAMP-binding protein